MGKISHIVVRDVTLGIMFHESDGTHHPKPIQKIFAGAHHLREVQQGRFYELHFPALSLGAAHHFLIFFACPAGAVRFSLTG